MSEVELTPMLTVKDASAAVDFYKNAFDAKELSRLSTPTGQLIVEMAIGALISSPSTRIRPRSTRARSRSVAPACA